MVSATWPTTDQVDFTSSDLVNELTAIASDVGSIDGDATVPTATGAKNHFTGTLRCLSSGAFVGEFSGDREGRVAFFVRAADGAVEGNGFTPDRDNAFTLSSISAETLDGQRRFISGGTSGGAEFDGRFDRDGSAEDEWGAENELTGETISGRFAGQRIAGALDADYRFAGTFENPDADNGQGVYAIDITGGHPRRTARPNGDRSVHEASWWPGRGALPGCRTCPTRISACDDYTRACIRSSIR